MSKAALAFLFGAVFAAAVAPAQPVARPTPPAGVDPQAGGRAVAPVLPLARADAETLRRRLQESLTRRRAQAPRLAALRAAGLPAESDAMETARGAGAGAAGPAGVALAVVPRVKPPAGVDPALASVARLTLRSRLDRPPTAAEVERELGAFDAQVEQANRWLAANRAGIAKSYAATGALPPAFDDEAVRTPPARRWTDSPAAREGLRALFRSLLTQPAEGTIPTPPTAPPGGPFVPRRPGTGPVVAPTPPTPVSPPGP